MKKNIFTSVGLIILFFTEIRMPFNIWSLCVSTTTCAPVDAAFANNSPIILCALGCKCASGFSISIKSFFFAFNNATRIGRTYVIPNPTLIALYELLTRSLLFSAYRKPTASASAIGDNCRRKP